MQPANAAGIRDFRGLSCERASIFSGFSGAGHVTPRPTGGDLSAEGTYPTRELPDSRRVQHFHNRPDLSTLLSHKATHTHHVYETKGKSALRNKSYESRWIDITGMDTWRERRAELFSKLADVADEFDDQWAAGKSSW